MVSARRLCRGEPELARQRSKCAERIFARGEHLHADVGCPGIEVTAHSLSQVRRSAVRYERVDGCVGGAVVEVCRCEPMVFEGSAIVRE